MKIVRLAQVKATKDSTQLTKDLLIRSFVLELAVEANSLTRGDVECFCSKLHVWLREEFNGDYAKMWDAFKQGRRPM